MEKDQYLLYKKKIIGNEKVATEELEVLQRQKPNRRVVGIPIYVWFYYLGKNTSDKERIQRKIDRISKRYDRKIQEETDPKKIAKIRRKRKRHLARLTPKLEKGSSFMQVIRPAAEAPEIYQDNLSKQTVAQMDLYLKSKGYFNGNVSYSTDTLKTRIFRRPTKRIKITYQIEENKPHILSDIEYVVEDTAIASLVENNKTGSFLKKGENYNVQKIANERERLERLLKDNGYYSFNRQYIDFEVDTAAASYASDSLNQILGNRRVNLDILIHNPSSGNHKVYRIDSVDFQLDRNEGMLGLPRSKEFYKGIKYSYYKDRYSQKVLNYKVFFRPGEKYSLKNTVETQRQLLNLDNFSFVNIVFDTTGGKFITRIITSPAKKYTTSEEIGVSVSQNLPGPTANVSFKIRNVFNGFENFESGVRYTFEGVAVAGKDKDPYRSQEVTATASLIFPQVLFPFNSRLKRTLNKYNPKTRLLSSYTFIDRPDYERSNFRSSFVYTWQKGLYNFFSIAPIDINLVNTYRTSGALKDSLASWEKKQYPLFYSFRKAIVSSINGSYTYNDYLPGVNKSARYFNFFAESGGTFINLLDTGFVRNGKIFDYHVFSYLRFSTDVRRYIPIGIKNTLAGRINMGFARPNISSNKALPYEKYFFAGGSTSIRAWKPRQLGPGSFNNFDSKGNKKFFENPGEILLEMSLEYRFNIIDLLNGARLDGACFVDAGNVWTYYAQAYANTEGSTAPVVETRPGAAWDWNKFYREIAVGAGAGLRVNFSFLIVRADMAYRIIDPAEPLGKRLVVGTIGKARVDDGMGGEKRNQNFRPVLHFGVNYPF